MPTSNELRGLRIIASRLVGLLKSGFLRLPPSYSPQDIDRVKDIAYQFSIRFSTNKFLSYEQLKVLDRAYTAHLEIMKDKEIQDIASFENHKRILPTLAPKKNKKNRGRVASWNKRNRAKGFSY